MMTPAMMTPATMTNERKIWEAVLLLVRRHGTAAAEIAQLARRSACAATMTS